MKNHHEQREGEAEGLLGRPRTPPQLVELHGHPRIRGSVMSPLFCKISSF